MPHGRLIYRHAPVAAVVGLAFESIAYAQTAETQLASPWIALYVFSFVFSLGMGASYLYFKTRRRVTKTLGGEKEEVIYVQPRHQRRETPFPAMGGEGLNVEDITSQTPIAQLLTAAQTEHQECPECGRHFDETLSVCPFDATPLRGVRRRQKVMADSSQSPAPTCTSCGRRYEDGATHCRHDGVELRMKQQWDKSPSVHVCKSCGVESLDGPSECCEDSDWSVVEPSETGPVPPLFPLAMCPACHHVAGPGESHCPHDHEVLRPILDMRIQVLSITGQGPRRKVCETCGTQYSISASFCAHDGKGLVDLN